MYKRQEHVLLSRGAQGVDWHGPDITLRAVPPRVEVASTVGAGDSLLAASLHGLLEGCLLYTSRCV